MELWVEEVCEVTEAVGEGSPVVLVGHSMGGGVALATAALHPPLVAGVALIDSAVWRPGLDRFEARFRQSSYPTREAAMEAFRLMPPQPPNREVEAMLAPLAVTERDGRWGWKWDPRALPSFSGKAVRDLLGRVKCPLIEVAGSLSDHVDGHSLRLLREATGQEVPLIEVDGAFHHVMLDRPAEVAAILLPWAERLRP